MMKDERQIHANQKPLRLSCLQNMISVFCRFERHLFCLRGLATFVGRGEHARMVVKKFMKPRSPSLYLQNTRNGDSAGKLHPYQFLDIDYTSIIDSPKERLSDHGFYSNNLKSVLFKVLKHAHKLPRESRFKALGGVTAGMGKGKTTSLEHIRSHLNKVPGTLAICVTFNNKTSPFDFIEYWNALRKENFVDSFSRARLVYALSIMARLSSSFYNMSLNTVTQEFLAVVSANIDDIVKCDPSVLLAVYVEALAKKLSEANSSEKPIDTVVVLHDESRPAAMEIRMLMGDDGSQHFDVTHFLREAMLEDLGGAELHPTSQNPSNRVTGTVVISSLHIKELGKGSSNRTIIPVSMAEAIPAWFILKRWWLAGVGGGMQYSQDRDMNRMFLLAELLSDVPRQVEIFDECVAKEMRNKLHKIEDVACQESLLPVNWMSDLTEEVLSRYEDSPMPSPPLMEKIVFRGEVPLTSEVLTLIATSFLSTVPHSFCSEHDDLPTTIVPEMSLFLSYLYAKKAIEKDLDVSLAMHAYTEMVQGIVDALQGKNNEEMGSLLEHCTHHTLKIRLEAARGAHVKTLSLGRLLGTDSDVFPMCGLSVDLSEPVWYIDMSGQQSDQQSGQQHNDEKATKLTTVWDSLYHQLNALELSPQNPTIVVRCDEVPYFDEILALLVNGEVHIVQVKCMHRVVGAQLLDSTGRLVQDGFYEMVNFFSGCALQESSDERLSNVAQAFHSGRNIHFAYLTTFPTVSARRLSGVKCKTAAGEGLVLTESAAQKFFGKSMYRFLRAASDLKDNMSDDSGDCASSDIKSFILKQIEKEEFAFKEEQFSPEQYAMWEKKE